MPIRKKIFDFLRKISSKKQSCTPAHRSYDLEQKSIVRPTIPTSSSSIQQSTTSPSHGSKTIDELLLYGRSSCPYCARVDRVIKELDIEDKITRRNTEYGSKWRTDLRERTGSTQVPCLLINGEAMFESLDIIDWMRNNFTQSQKN